jgi:hypothetical protein
MVKQISSETTGDTQAPAISSQELLTIETTQDGISRQTVVSVVVGNWEPRTIPEVEGPYKGLMQFLVDNRLTMGLPLDSRGDLQVSVPFCAHFLEADMLCRLLAQHCVAPNGPAKRAHVYVTDITDHSDPMASWPMIAKWASKAYPMVPISFKASDLSKEKLPQAGLVLAMHPEVTKGGIWHDIVANVLRAAQGGLCVFGHFFEQEMQCVFAECEKLGIKAQAFENSFYRGRDMPSSPFIRYIVVARPGSAAVPLPAHPEALNVTPQFLPF